MKVILGVVLALAVAATAQLSSVEDLSAYNYHTRIGIPEARRVKKLEEEAAKAGDASGIVGDTITDISEAPYQIGVDSFGAVAGCSVGLPAAYAIVTSYTSWLLAQ